MKGKIATTALVLLLLTIGGEAMLCASPSKTYVGQCYRSENCAAVCTTENFTGGYCHGEMPRKCMCTKDCGEGGGGDLPPSPDGEGGGEPPPAEFTATARRARPGRA